MRLSFRRVILAVVLGCAALPIIFCSGLLAGGTGSPREAHRLRTTLQAIPDPDAAWAALGNGAAVKHYEGGEWVFGLGTNSHQWMGRFLGGGTAVVKDSRGDVRAFFGHVCGPRGLHGYVEGAQTLDELYGILRRNFTEYQFPDG